MLVMTKGNTGAFIKEKNPDSLNSKVKEKLADTTETKWICEAYEVLKWLAIFVINHIRVKINDAIDVTGVKS